MVLLREKTFLLFLAVSVFFVGASEFMLSAMLGPLGDAFQTSSAGAAWLISSYAFSYALAAPLLGYWSDRIDRRKLLHRALLLFAMDGAAITLAPSIATAIGLRALGGLASAVLIPTAFALIAEIIPRERQASAMGRVLLGMTLGIALGPALAGMLTASLGWRAPFLAIAASCVIAFAVGLKVMPRQVEKSPIVGKPGLAWLTQGSVLRPLIAKGAWNGTGVAAFLLSGQILAQRYHLGVAQVGLSMAVFGGGLGIGNLLAGRLRHVCGREEFALVILTLLLLVSITLFIIVPSLPLWGALVCLGGWGAALGAGAPSSTVVLAARAGANKGMVLAFAETLNNIAIFTLAPIASARLLHAGNEAAMCVFAVGLGVGIALTLVDAITVRTRQGDNVI